MKNLRIFIVEDDPWFAQLISQHLSLNPDYEVQLYKSGKECLSQLHLKPDIVCVDFGLPDMQGDALFEKIQQVNRNIPVIIISGQTDVAVALKLLKNGAKDYLMKDEHTKDLLWNSILKIRETMVLRKEVDELREQLQTKYGFDKVLVGNSPALLSIFGLAEKAADSNINVSITGETGTGKEVLARAIHLNGERRKKPFVAVNMSAIPEGLAESELFGHEKGAFTGADSRRIGKFEEANGGTIFLDEIAEMDLQLQSKILRVLQEREVVRIGGNQKIKIDVRVITATHKNLPDEIRKGNFREDLFYRIMGLPIELPPLRYRGNDILILARHFAKEFSDENRLKPMRFSPRANDKLLKYSYPGNVRELKAVVDLACVLCGGQDITEEHVLFNSVRPEEFFTGQEKTLKEYSREIVFYFLSKYDHNVKEVAKRLDIGKSTIYALMQNDGINT